MWHGKIGSCPDTNMHYVMRSSLKKVLGSILLGGKNDYEDEIVYVYDYTKV